MSPPIFTPDGNEVSEIVLPDGSIASEVVAPDGSVVFEGPDIPDSVTNHYPTDEGSGTNLTDNEGTIDGTIEGATWQTGAGTNDTFLLYDGTNDYTDFNNPGSPLLPETADWTAFFWVRPDAIDVETILSQYIRDTGNGRLVIRIGDSNTDEFTLFLGGDNSEPTVKLTSAVGITIGEYYSVAVRRSGNDFALFVNGNKEATHTDSGTRNILQTGNLYGARNSTGDSYDSDRTEFWEGGADEFWVASGTALSDSEISDFHNATVSRYPE
jgi:hypothetical protein